MSGIHNFANNVKKLINSMYNPYETFSNKSTNLLKIYILIMSCFGPEFRSWMKYISPVSMIFSTILIILFLKHDNNKRGLLGVNALLCTCYIIYRYAIITENADNTILNMCLGSVLMKYIYYMARPILIFNILIWIWYFGFVFLNRWKYSLKLLSETSIEKPIDYIIKTTILWISLLSFINYHTIGHIMITHIMNGAFAINNVTKWNELSRLPSQIVNIVGFCLLFICLVYFLIQLYKILGCRKVSCLKEKLVFIMGDFVVIVWLLTLFVAQSILINNYIFTFSDESVLLGKFHNIIFHSIYIVLMTISTTGFGDFVPNGVLGKIVIMTIILTGMFFLTIFVGTFMGNSDD